MEPLRIISFSFLALVTLLTTGCITTTIRNFSMTASEAPEVHGANTEQESFSAMWRFTGKVHYNFQEDVDITDDTYKDGSLDDLFSNDDIMVKKSTYRMGGVDLSGKIDFLYKVGWFMCGGGLGYKDGAFLHTTLGANFSHFELGAFLGVYNQYSEMSYEIEKDDETDWGYDSDFNASLFGGGYAGFYLEKLFFNLSVSAYEPNPKIEDIRLSVPTITTGYLTAGYRINRWVEFSVGGIVTYTSEEFNGGVTSGISLYL